eukprot:c8967_g2_i2.p1 GENE.c8967_g2_i2~~c8967_g2_i2.p1  ORF type:complete len:229 (+),score=26.89 c8967_g2_i2:1199-1885(+)
MAFWVGGTMSRVKHKHVKDSRNRRFDPAFDGGRVTPRFTQSQPIAHQDATRPSLTSRDILGIQNLSGFDIVEHRPELMQQNKKTYQAEVLEPQHSGAVQRFSTTINQTHEFIPTKAIELAESSRDDIDQPEFVDDDNEEPDCQRPNQIVLSKSNFTNDYNHARMLDFDRVRSSNSEYGAVFCPSTERSAKSKSHTGPSQTEHSVRVVRWKRWVSEEVVEEVSGCLCRY